MNAADSTSKTEKWVSKAGSFSRRRSTPAA
jgi:hypothetical protein